MTNEDLLSLNKICYIAVCVDAFTVKACSRHELAPAADEAIVKRKVVVFAVKFLDVPLNDGHSPAGSEPIVGKH
jgi:hypothetical protein